MAAADRIEAQAREGLEIERVPEPVIAGTPYGNALVLSASAGDRGGPGISAQSFQVAGTDRIGGLGEQRRGGEFSYAGQRFDDLDIGGPPYL